MIFPTHIVAATGYVLDDNDNILLVKTYNRGWDAAGGQIEIGESIEEGVLREILEESGITATMRSLVGVYSNVGIYTAQDGVTHIPTKVLLEFVCDYVSGAPTPSNETSEVRWVPMDEALKYVTYHPRRFCFEKMLAFDGRVCYASYVTKPEFRLLSERFM